MKKSLFFLTLVLSLMFGLSTFALADGETHDGGRYCPPDQTCSTDSANVVNSSSFSITDLVITVINLTTGH